MKDLDIMRSAHPRSFAARAALREESRWARLGEYRRNQRRVAFALVLACLGGCERAKPPTIDEVRRAYAAHMRLDPVHELGMRAKTRPALIPTQEPLCTADNASHFDCRIDVFYEAAGARRSSREFIHIVRQTHGWQIESVN